MTRSYPFAARYHFDAGEYFCLAVMALGAGGMVYCAQQVVGAPNWGWVGFAACAAFTVPLLLQVVIYGLREFISVWRGPVDSGPDTIRDIPADISGDEIEDEIPADDLGRGDWGHFLTLVRQHNAGLPEDEQDEYRLWRWDDLGISAWHWSDVTHALRDAHWCVIGDAGTWLTFPAGQFATMIYTRAVNPPPYPEKWRGKIAAEQALNSGTGLG